MTNSSAGSGVYIEMARIVCSVLWMGISIAASTGVATKGFGLVMLAWFGALALLLVTAAITKPQRQEQLMQPVVYRTVAAAMLAIVLAGGVFALVPGASSRSHVYGVFFGVVAILVYRALIAPGPGRALVVAAICSLVWAPFVFVTLVGCRRYRHLDIPEPHWTEAASTHALQLFLFGLPVLVAAALVAFKPQQGDLPEARVV